MNGQQCGYLLSNGQRFCNTGVDRTKLTLDFSQTPKKTDNANQNNPCFLDSPDMQMLKVPSPELEKMILDSYPITAGSSTPTPTQFVNPKVLSRPDHVAQSYAPENLFVTISSGPNKFVNSVHPITTGTISNTITVSSIQYRDNLVASGNSVQSGSFGLSNLQCASPQSTTNNKDRLLITVPISSHSISVQPTCPISSSVANISSQPAKCNISSTYVGSDYDQMSNSNSPVSVKTEPGYLSSSESVQHPSISEQSPVQILALGCNPVVQEQIKQERKRLRNRIAATKCRKRKLEKISTLEDQVKELKESNVNLSEQKHQLREQIEYLKKKMLMHLKNGCQVHVGPNMDAL